MVGEKIRSVEGLHPVEWLRSEYVRRRDRNPSYSLRAFARHLGVAPGPLSEILAKKRGLSLKLARRIAEQLSLTPQQYEVFLKPLQNEKDVRCIVNGSKTETQLRELSIDAYYLIADWYHYAILSLVETKNFQSRVQWIARRLGISVVEVRGALERLERLGLIEKQKNRWVVNQSGVTSTHDVPSAALKKAHKQQLEIAKQSLDDVAVSDRDVTSIMMAADPKRLPIAKEMVRHFRRSLSQFLESGDQTEVYNLSIQLVPLTKKEKKGD